MSPCAPMQQYCSSNPRYLSYCSTELASLLSYDSRITRVTEEEILYLVPDGSHPEEQL